MCQLGSLEAETAPVSLTSDAMFQAVSSAREKASSLDENIRGNPHGLSPGTRARRQMAHVWPYVKEASLG